VPNAFILQQKKLDFFCSVNSTIFADFWGKSHQNLDINRRKEKRNLKYWEINCAPIFFKVQ
jgi:hypothetical protein